MGSVLEERHRRAAQCCLLLQKLPSEAASLDWSHERLRGAEEKTLEGLEELCAPEILRAVLGNWMSAGLCGVYVGVVQAPPYTALYLLREDLEIIYRSIREAARSVAASGKRFHEHVESCVAKNIVQEAADRVKELRQLKTRPLLELLTTVTLDRVRFTIAHLAEDQRRGLSRLLYRELGDKPTLLRMDKELSLPAQPTLRQRYAWVFSYLWRLKMHSAEVRQSLGGVPQVIAVGDGDRMLINPSTGQLADPLGAIHAPVWRMLSRELNKHGHSIKDPESERRIAKSVGVSRDKLRSYPDLPIKIKPDGKGRVAYEFTGDDVLKSFEASLRKKPKREEQ